MRLNKYISDLNRNVSGENSELSSSKFSSFLYNNIIKCDPDKYIKEENEEMFKFVVVSEITEGHIVSFIDSVYDYCEKNEIKYIINFGDITNAKTSNTSLRALFVYLKMANLEDVPSAFEVELGFNNNKIVSIKLKDIINKDHVLGDPRVKKNKNTFTK